MQKIAEMEGLDISDDKQDDVVQHVRRQRCVSDNHRRHMRRLRLVHAREINVASFPAKRRRWLLRLLRFVCLVGQRLVRCIWLVQNRRERQGDPVRRMVEQCFHRIDVVVRDKQRAHLVKQRSFKLDRLPLYRAKFLHGHQQEPVIREDRNHIAQAIANQRRRQREAFESALGAEFVLRQPRFLGQVALRRPLGDEIRQQSIQPVRENAFRQERHLELLRANRIRPAPPGE
mmetsp:Transcript_13017/g.34523  ORF Transcript_13017/g.34523 Transcript_13017/m.34523 type:complete len:231 (-) Transcript_13017:957-1649(-)